MEEAISFPQGEIRAAKQPKKPKAFNGTVTPNKAPRQGKNKAFNATVQAPKGQGTKAPRQDVKQATVAVPTTGNTKKVQGKNVQQAGEVQAPQPDQKKKKKQFDGTVAVRDDDDQILDNSDTDVDVSSDAGDSSVSADVGDAGGSDTDVSTPDNELPDDTEAREDDQQGDDQDADQQAPKATSDGVVEGYPIVFNSLSQDLGGFKETVDPEALQGVSFDGVMLLANHDYSQPLAKYPDTLQLDIDEHGLHMKAELDLSVSYARDAYQNVINGNQASMSFRFDIADGIGDEFLRADDGSVIRHITKISQLFEVSIVTVPAYASANVSTGAEKQAVRSYEKFLQQEKGANRMYTKVENGLNNSETRSFENYIRSRGEKRDGLTSQNANMVIPDEIVLPILELKQSKLNLAKLTNQKQVGTSYGNYPIASDLSNSPLADYTEGEELPDDDEELFTNVEWRVHDFATKIKLSNDLIEDSKVDIIGEVKKQLRAKVDATDNKHILDLLNGKDAAGKDNFVHMQAAGFDELKDAFNEKLEPQLDKGFIMNQSAFNYLDKIKDDRGDFVLQRDPAEKSEWLLLGAPVQVVPNRLLPNNADGTFPIFVGDFTEALVTFRRSDVEAQWDKFDFASQGLSVLLRADYEIANPKAAAVISLGQADATTTTTKKA